DNVGAGQHQLTVSRLGYATQTLPVQVTADQIAQLDFKMEERAVTLDEIVVTGYSVTARRERTGAEAQVKRAVIEAMPVTTADQAIQGRTAGVQVRSNSGQPGGATTVRIRGVGSIGGTGTTPNAVNPLYIVDGVQLAADRQGGNQPVTSPLAAIDPDDIETIEVLKDAAATSIYGAQAANGVVLITTRRGAAGATKFTFQSEMGVVTNMRTWDVLSGPEWVRIQMEAQGNRSEDTGAPRSAGEAAAIAAYGRPDSVGTYDWQGAVLRDGITRKYNMSV